MTQTTNALPNILQDADFYLRSSQLHHNPTNRNVQFLIDAELGKATELLGKTIAMPDAKLHFVLGQTAMEAYTQDPESLAFSKHSIAPTSQVSLEGIKDNGIIVEHDGERLVVLPDDLAKSRLSGGQFLFGSVKD